MEGLRAATSTWAFLTGSSTHKPYAILANPCVVLHTLAFLCCNCLARLHREGHMTTLCSEPACHPIQPQTPGTSAFGNAVGMQFEFFNACQSTVIYLGLR